MCCAHVVSPQTFNTGKRGGGTQFMVCGNWLCGLAVALGFLAFGL
jgi:hypothetical protein